MPRKKSRKSSKLLNNKQALLAGLVVLLVAVVAGGILINNHANSNSSKTTGNGSGSNKTGGNTNLRPPTEQEKQAAQDYKKNLSNPPPPPSVATDGKKQVSPIVTSYQNGNVYSYVSGVFEDGGICTATATYGSAAPVVKTSTGFGDSNHTACPPIDLSLSPGTWTIVVEYSSSTSEGKSQTYSAVVN